MSLHTGSISLSSKMKGFSYSEIINPMTSSNISTSLLNPMYLLWLSFPGPLPGTNLTVTLSHLLQDAFVSVLVGKCLLFIPRISDIKSTDSQHGDIVIMSVLRKWRQ